MRYVPDNALGVDDEGDAGVDEAKEALANLIGLVGFAFGVTQNRVLGAQ